MININYTQTYSFQKPISEEKYDVNVFNANMDLIDSALNRIDKKNQNQDELFATKELLEAETLRATNKEIAITGDLTSEISRAKSSESELSERITAETNRASTAENTMNENFSTLISKLTERLNALADSDDTTLDQLSEIVSYIKNNKDLIDGVTTNKVNVSDIIDNLISTEISKPLSGNQGRILKEMITSLTKEDIGLGNVDNKSSEVIRAEITKDNVISALGYTPSNTDTTYDIVSTSSNGLCPKRDNDTSKFLRADGTWAKPSVNEIIYNDSEPVNSVNGMTWIGK